MSVLGLGIESSCDETSIAVVRDGREELSNVIYSQVAEHAPFRGVVPEIASRAHLEKINTVFEAAIDQGRISPADLDYVAVTSHPGLIGSLMIGAQLARTLALVFNTPLVAVDHLQAHFFAVALEGVEIQYPFLGLLLSGGNSALYRVDGPAIKTRIADTRDDALGEAFDKVAAIMNLPYPGGPVIEELAAGFPNRSSQSPLFPRLLKNTTRRELGFSFSGIKTAVLRAHRDGRGQAEICFHFQNSVFELVERMVGRAVEITGIRRVIASGGVLANETLKERLHCLARAGEWELHFPRARRLCTDNGGMVAALGYPLFRQGVRSPLDFLVSSKR